MVPTAPHWCHHPQAPIKLIFLQENHSPPSSSDNSTPPPAYATSNLPSTTTISINEFISYVWVFNNLESWDALRWRAPRDHECLWLLSKIFQDSEKVATQRWLVLLPTCTMAYSSIQCPLCLKQLHMYSHCPAPLVDLSMPPPTTPSDTQLGQPEPWLQSLCGPGQPGMPLPNNPIPASHLQDLTYIRMASAMADAITQVTGDDHTPWAQFFMVVKDDPVNQHLYNTMATLHPLPDQAFQPLVINTSLWYYLAGKKDILATSPLFPYHCYKCDQVGHWSWEHNSNQLYWKPGMLRNNQQQNATPRPSRRMTM
ncbi:hypothetical protein V8B97DRAFT_1914018 [Scleroderma yunnanense]